MQLESFKEEYCKSSISISGLNITIKKLPAIKGAGFFTSLMKTLFSKVKDIELSDQPGEVEREMMLSVISGLDEEYLENILIPTLFKCMSYNSEDGKIKHVNLWETRQMAESYLSFDDIFELILRGVCVNFMPSLLARYSKLQMSKSLTTSQ